MVKARQRIWIGLMMLLLILIVLGGCSKATESPQSESKSNSETDTKIIKTVDGDVEIPANPQRIVTQGYLANF